LQRRLQTGAFNSRRHSERSEGSLFVSQVPARKPRFSPFLFVSPLSVFIRVHLWCV
jgi:hypothetical protein